MNRFSLTSAAVACLALSATTQGQSTGPEMIGVGDRVRFALTDHVLPSPRARAGKLRNVIGTVRAIEADTIRLESSAGDSLTAVARVLIYYVERSLGKHRTESANDAAVTGAGVGVIAMIFFPKRLQPVIGASGLVLGTLFGVVHPFERWEYSWLPE